MERRNAPRLALRFKVLFSPAGQEEQVAGSGTTENVSAGGLYFRTRDWQLLAKGETIGLTVSGLSQYDHGPLFRVLKGQGTVLRLDAAESPESRRTDPGVAVRFREPLHVEGAVPPA
jgi:hypothetical protein